MTPARLFGIVLLLCSVPAFTQDQQSGKAPLIGEMYSGRMIGQVFPQVSGSMDARTTPAELWRIIPSRPSDLSSDSPNRGRVDGYRFDQGKVDFNRGHPETKGKTAKVIHSLDWPTDDDTTCYTIRSYVVARDSKDSDSTHPVGYSTCQPAARYRLKTTEEPPVSLER